MTGGLCLPITAMSVEHSPRHFPSRTFPLTQTINLTLTPNTNPTSPNRNNPILTLTLTEHIRGECPRGTVQGNCPFPTTISRQTIYKTTIYKIRNKNNTENEQYSDALITIKSLHIVYFRKL